MNSIKKSLVSCLANIEILQTVGVDCLISSIEYDSRKIEAGAVFFALPGLHSQGIEFIDDAIARGAQAIVYQGEVLQRSFAPTLCVLRVADARVALSACSAAFYDYPATSMCLIGVTGTEGKSSTVAFIAQLLQGLGKKTGFFSTVSYCYGATVMNNPEHQTTPEANTVHRHLAEMRGQGCEYAVLEASSHGLSPRTARLLDVPFQVGVCTNVRHEHLEFHGSFENYRADKARLFANVVAHADPSQPFFVLMNATDPSFDFFKAQAGTVPMYAVYGKPDDIMTTVGLYPSDINDSAQGLAFTLNEVSIVPRGNHGDVLQINQYHLQTVLRGTFNVDNIMMAIEVVRRLLPVELDEIVTRACHLNALKGRMYAVDEGQNFSVFIDYAHTPSAFEAILAPMRTKADAEQRRIITLFGSGGERDTKKRAEQGRIAAAYSDIVILTDEDPRGEDPMTILKMIAQGCKTKTRDKDLFLIPNRQEAIRHAFSSVQRNDVVLLLGKGHENSIIYKNGAEPYDEEATARHLLRQIL